MGGAVAATGFFSVDLVLLVHRNEQIRVIPDALGVAQHQKAAGIQRVVKHGQQLPLKRAVHVNQDVPTAYQIEMRERRVAREILPREHAHIANRFGHLVAAVGLREEAAQPFRRDVIGNRRGVQPLPRKADGAFADVGPEDLHAAVLERVAENFAYDDRERIHFFAGRTAGHPHAQRCARCNVPCVRQDITRDDLKRFGFAKKPCDMDQQVVVEVHHLQRRLLQMGDVRRRPQSFGGRPCV